jgi:hypothetical protein
VEGDILMSLLLKILEKRNNTQKLGKEAEMEKIGKDKELKEEEGDDDDELSDEGDNKKLKKKDEQPEPEPVWKSYPPFIDNHNRLFVVIMSATINEKSFSIYFNNAPVIHVEGKSFEVKRVHLPETLSLLHKTISFVPNPKANPSPYALSSCEVRCYYYYYFFFLCCIFIFIFFLTILFRGHRNMIFNQQLFDILILSTQRQEQWMSI